MTRTPSGTVRAWGDNSGGQLGTGGSVASYRPVRVVSTSGHGVLTGVVTSLATGGDTFDCLAVDASGADRGHRICVHVSASRSGYPGNLTTTRAVSITR